MNFKSDAWLSPDLRWIQVFTAGLDHLPPPPDSRSVLLTTTSGVLGAAIAEHVLALILALVRRLPQTMAAQRLSRWLSWQRGEYDATELSGKTLGIIGLGTIGQQVAARAYAFGMNILGVRRSAARVTDEWLEVPPRDRANPKIPVTVYPANFIDGMLSMSDVVVIAVPLTSETHLLIDRRRIQNMRPSTVLINVSRGLVMDENALIEGLRSGKLLGAGLDVFSNEPLPPESPLWKMPGVIVTPHVAGVSDRIASRVLEFFKLNLSHYLRHEPLQNIVGPASWPT